MINKLADASDRHSENSEHTFTSLNLGQYLHVSLTSLSRCGAEQFVCQMSPRILSFAVSGLGIVIHLTIYILQSPRIRAREEMEKKLMDDWRQSDTKQVQHRP